MDANILLTRLFRVYLLVLMGISLLAPWTYSRIIISPRYTCFPEYQSLPGSPFCYEPILGIRMVAMAFGEGAIFIGNYLKTGELDKFGLDLIGNAFAFFLFLLPIITSFVVLMTPKKGFCRLNLVTCGLAIVVILAFSPFGILTISPLKWGGMMYGLFVLVGLALEIITLLIEHKNQAKTVEIPAPITH